MYSSLFTLKYFMVMFANSKVNDKLYFLNINSITKNPELYIGTILTAGNPIDPPLKPGEFRNPNIR